MKLLKYIPIALFVWSTFLYDLLAPRLYIEIEKATVSNTNWSVFYFTVLYLAWLVDCVHKAIKTDWLYFGMMSSVIVLRVGLELNKIGMGYKQYVHSVTSLEQNIVILIWSFVTLLTIVVHYGNNRNNKRVVNE